MRLHVRYFPHQHYCGWSCDIGMFKMVVQNTHSYTLPEEEQIRDERVPRQGSEVHIRVYYFSVILFVLLH